jgi:hypothetical protein
MPRAGLYCLLLCLAVPSAATQNTAPCARIGEIDVQVRDPSGAALPSTGTLSGQRTNRKFRTNATGTALLSALEFGTYQLRVLSPGFASRMLTVVVSSVTPISREVTLSVQSVTTNVTAFTTSPIGQASTSSTDSGPDSGAHRQEPGGQQRA